MSEWRVSEALTSVRRLEELIPTMADAEIEKLIALEEEAQRRKVFLDKLYREMRQRARKKFSR